MNRMHRHHRHHHGGLGGLGLVAGAAVAGAAVGLALSAQPPPRRYRQPVQQTRTVVVTRQPVVQRTVVVQQQPVVQTVMAPTITTRPAVPAGYSAVQVRVPQGVYPGQPFQIDVSGRRMSITCPATATAGSLVTVNVPPAAPAPAAVPTYAPAPAAVPTASYASGAVPTAVPAAIPTAKTRVKVTVPAGVSPGMQFQATAFGRAFMVTCPPGGYPGGQVEIQV